MAKGSNADDSKITRIKESIPGIIQGIRLSIRKKVQYINNNIIHSKDVITLSKVIVEMVIDGLLIGALLFPFIGFKLFNIIIFGAAWYFIKNQGLVELRQLISSFNLVRINK